MIHSAIPTVTVLITTFNRRKQLIKAIESVIDQDLNAVIIHIFDNCSEDGTQELVNDFQSRYRNIFYTRRTENIGALANYADAIASVETLFYLPLADDDWLLPGSLHILLEEILKDNKLGAVISQTVHVYSDGRESRLNPDESWEYRRYEPREFLPLWVKKGHFEWSSLIFRTSAVRDIGGLDISTRSPSDVDFQLQLFMRYPVKMIKHRSAVYLNHPNQCSVQPDPKMALGFFRMIVKANAFLDANPDTPKEIKDAVDAFSKHWCDVMAHNLAKYAKFSDYKIINLSLEENLPYPDLRKLYRTSYLNNKLKTILPYPVFRMWCHLCNLTN